MLEKKFMVGYNYIMRLMITKGGEKYGNTKK